ncbi:polyhydroxyalkanoate synthesis regulator DNA-binding domain-containing protein [Lentzea xinjiangensis]|uniref:polyhydroxyalkanoate synthesis regulator DNA-binding domain-containing protein n=1 Tax=Lentzea xinjiangensis TaxID=402600 RepID=UPI0011604013|nr:polyhydroxyalkanoate synthesis regulator DNA-binding domain-containing protein [Lentzea xinjiangensis]
MDGTLRDGDTRDAIAIADLVDGLRSGRRFQVRTRDTGEDCTAEVLAEVLVEVMTSRGGIRRAGPLEPLLGIARADPPRRRPRRAR